MNNRHICPKDKLPICTTQFLTYKWPVRKELEETSRQAIPTIILPLKHFGQEVNRPQLLY